MSQKHHGWWRMADGKVILPEKLGEQCSSKLYRTTHMGTRKMQDLIRWAYIKIKDAHPKIEQIVSHCKACQMTNAACSSAHPGTKLRGTKPGAYWETDFTEIKKGSFGYKYLLVFIDTFSGWVEAFPTKHETAHVVAKKLLEDILPRYGFPAMMGSDNRPAFASKVIQGLATVLGADWKLHCA